MPTDCSREASFITKQKAGIAVNRSFQDQTDAVLNGKTFTTFQQPNYNSADLILTRNVGCRACTVANNFAIYQAYLTSVEKGSPDTSLVWDPNLLPVNSPGPCTCGRS